MLVAIPHVVDISHLIHQIMDSLQLSGQFLRDIGNWRTGNRGAGRAEQDEIEIAELCRFVSRHGDGNDVSMRRTYFM